MRYWLFLAAALALSGTGAGSATTWYVATNGSDTANFGTNQFAAIQGLEDADSNHESILITLDVVGEVPASTTTTRLLLPMRLKPNRFVRTPNRASRVCACGFHSTAERPSNGECQPVVPGK